MIKIFPSRLYSCFLSDCVGGNKFAVGFLADLDQLLAQTALLDLMPFGFHWSLDPLTFGKAINRLPRHPILLPQFLKGESSLFQIPYQIVFLTPKNSPSSNYHLSTHPSS